MTYDSQGNVLTTIDPLGRTSTYADYTSFNLPQHVTDPGGVSTTLVYDPSGHLLTKSTPITGGTTATTTYAYDSAHPGDVLTATDPENRITTYTYDANGMRASALDPAGDKTTYVYDAIGRMTSSVAPLGNVTGGTPSQYTTTYTTNAFGNPLTVTDPLNEVTTFGYDANQNKTSVKDANNHTTTYSFDYDNELTLVTRPDASTMGTVYDGNGNVTQQVDGLNHATVYAYDVLNRKTSVTDALSRATGYAYDLAGNLTTLTDADNHATTYSYDSANELIRISYQTGTPGNVTYSYDLDGRRTSMLDPTGTTAYVYDSLGRLTSNTDGAGATVGYGYDRSSRITSIAYPASLGTVIRGYDSAGRLSSVADWLSHSTAFGYDANSEMTSITYPNTVTAANGYDRAGHLISISDKQGINAPFFTESYSRDLAGQLTGNGSQSFGYDTQNRLTSGGLQGYGYDPADRITTVNTTGGNQGALAYDNADQLQTYTQTVGGTQVQKYTYAFDSRGNRTSKTDVSNNVSTYGWDQANRMVSYQAGSASASYSYNGDGLLLSKSLNGTPEAFAWDAADGLPLMIKDGTTAYVTGPGGLPLEQVVGSTVRYFHSDQIGSTRGITDSSGAFVQSYAYDPYGNVTTTSGSIANPFQFQGQFLDSATGLYYLRARHYDPATAQFTSWDPMVSLTKAAYSYVADTPLNGTDATGMAWWSSGAASVVGGIGWFVGQASDNLHSGNPTLVALGVGQVIVISMPVAAVIFVAGGGAAVAAGLDALGGGAAFDATAVIMPRVAAAEAGYLNAGAFGDAVWGDGAAEARALIGTRSASELEAIGLSPRLACGLRNFYQALKPGVGGATPARVELMQHILEVLTKS